MSTYNTNEKASCEQNLINVDLIVVDQRIERIAQALYGTQGIIMAYSFFRKDNTCLNLWFALKAVSGM